MERTLIIRRTTLALDRDVLPARRPSGTDLIPQKLAHVFRAQVDIVEVLEELLLGHPEDPVIALHGPERLLHARVFVPARAVVVPVPVLELAVPVRVPHLHHVEAGPGDVFERPQHRVRVPVDDAVGILGVVPGAPRAGTDDVVVRVPRGDLLEQVVRGDIAVDTAVLGAHVGPLHGPNGAGGFLDRAVLRLPLVLVRVVLAEATVHAVVAATDRVHLLAPGQDAPRVRALPAVDLVPTAAVHRESLLQVTHPQLAVVARGGAEELARVPRVRGEALVDDHVHGLPRAEVVQRHVVLVRRFTRHVLDPAGGVGEEFVHRAVELGERGDGGEQPAVADLALVDVVRVDIADDLEARDVRAPHPAPGLERRVVHRVMQLVAAVVHAVGVRVGGAADVDLREGFVPAHDPRLPPVVILLGLEALPALAHVERVVLLVLGPIRLVRLVRDCEVLPGVRLELRDPVRDQAVNRLRLPGLLVRVTS
mmetsp:Transcript_9513/g.43277  ORF Transcript_9513/g.43277 Transcript_9513/m.43277 type:complete len:480 (-) Transcript_9513:247-1686(-)